MREPICRRPTLLGLPRPDAPPCAARPNPPVVCPGFGFDRLFVNLSSPKPRHTTGRSGRDGAQRGGGAGPVRTAAGVSPRTHGTLLPLRVSTTSAWTTFQKHEPAKPYVNRRGNTTRVCIAFHPRLISGTKSALRSWLLTSGPAPFCLCKPFSCKACPGIWRNLGGRKTI